MNISAQEEEKEIEGDKEVKKMLKNEEFTLLCPFSEDALVTCVVFLGCEIGNVNLTLFVWKLFQFFLSFVIKYNTSEPPTRLQLSVTNKTTG